MTVRLAVGIVTEMFFRLCVRAPRIRIEESWFFFKPSNLSELLRSSESRTGGLGDWGTGCLDLSPSPRLPVPPSDSSLIHRHVVRAVHGALALRGGSGDEDFRHP